MHIWVDADACPKVIKEILYRAADRTLQSLTLVANVSLSVPPSSFIKSITVPQGFDVADNYIVQHVEEGDIVITADIPLAARCLEVGCSVLGSNGRPFDEDMIGSALATRQLKSDLRDAGVTSGGAAGPVHQGSLAFFVSSLLMSRSSRPGTSAARRTARRGRRRGRESRDGATAVPCGPAGGRRRRRGR